MKQRLSESRSDYITKPRFKSITYRTQPNPEEIWTKTPTRINTDISIDKGRRTPTISVERFSLKRKRLSEVKVGYLDMFHTHINLTRISNTQRNGMSVRAKLNVRLPQIFENPSSDFIVLDPVAIPIQYISTAIDDSKLLLQKIQSQTFQIRTQLLSISDPINFQLQQIKQTTMNKLKVFRQLIRQDCTKHCTNKIQALRGINQYKHFIDSFVQQIVKSVDDTLEIQKQIFEKELPFELVMEEENILTKKSLSFF